eukprot:14411402-Heterocapsa_arctica.AAC.1
MDQDRPDSRRAEASAATYSGGCLMPDKVDRVNSVMTSAMWDRSRTRMLLDSGSFMHVCPPTFAPEIPLRKDDMRMRAVRANGQPLRCYGRKR